MTKRWAFDDQESFLARLREILDSGVSPERLQTISPYPVHEVEHLLHLPGSHLRFFTLGGALAGCLTGFGLTIYTALDWPLITGGKPIVSLAPYLIIAFELTILFGALATFAGFLILARFPQPQRMIQPEEHGNQFIILLEEDA